MRDFIFCTTFFLCRCEKEWFLKSDNVIFNPQPPSTPPTHTNTHSYLHSLEKLCCVSSVGNNSNWTLKTLPFSSSSSSLSLSLEIDFIKDFPLYKKSENFLKMLFHFIRKISDICWLLKLKEIIKDEINRNQII